MKRRAHSNKNKQKNVEKKRNVKEEEIENEFVDEILKKKRESESAIFKKLERINQYNILKRKFFSNYSWEHFLLTLRPNESPI